MFQISHIVKTISVVRSVESKFNIVKHILKTSISSILVQSNADIFGKGKTNIFS